MRRFFRAVISLLLLAGITSSVAAQSREVQGFADVNYLATERAVDDGFVLGQLVGHAAFGLTDRLAVFTEVSLSGRASEYAIEAERLMLRYEFADFLKLSAGRYHTPISYWNTAFHHGMWLQTSVGRPEFVKFGSRFVPVHFVGLLAEGSLPTLALNPGYYVGVGNGRGSNIARAGDRGDVNDQRAWLAGVVVRPFRPDGLEAGAALYRDHVGVEGDVKETIYSAHVRWASERPEVIGEYARVLHNPLGGPGESIGNDAYYLQLAYRLTGRFRNLKPYVRGEKIDAPVRDPVFGSLDLEYDAAIIGIRYDLAMLAAIKLEYRNERFDAGNREGSLYAQVSFTFPGPDTDPMNGRAPGMLARNPR